MPLFRTGARSPQDIVKSLRDSLIQLERNRDNPVSRKKSSEEVSYIPVSRIRCYAVYSGMQEYRCYENHLVRTGGSGTPAGAGYVLVTGGLFPTPPLPANPIHPHPGVRVPQGSGAHFQPHSQATTWY